MAETQLGILVTKHENLGHIAGIVRAARKAGHRVRVFLNDEGVRFSRDPGFLELLALGGVEVAVCDHFREKLGIEEKAAGVTFGSQYDNAVMLHECERVLVF
jgi:sulfur relay (sulfurtransferase) complex TusBCD TusD component (DsrE family)